MRIALATCSTLPAWEHDDVPLHAALRGRGVEVEQPVWDDPAVDWSRYDLVLIRTTWDYQAKPLEFVAWAEHVAGVSRLHNSARVVAWNTDKRYLRDLDRAGVAIAPTRWFERGAAVTLAEEVAGLGLERGFLKPVIAANSRGTLRFDATNPVALAAAQAHLDSSLGAEAMMLQPYLSAVESEGELSLILFDGQPSHAVRKVPVAGDFRVQDDFGAHDEPIELSDDIAAAAEATLQALAVVARAQGWADELPLVYARVDLLRDRHGALLLNELELVEPSLFLRHAATAADRLSEALVRRI